MVPTKGTGEAAVRKPALVIVLAAAFCVFSCVKTGPVKDAQQACAIVKDRMAASINAELLPKTYCDIMPEASDPAGYYVLSLHSGRSCEGICSDNMGWFAVEMATGRVLEWDVADMKLGKPFR